MNIHLDESVCDRPYQTEVVGPSRYVFITEFLVRWEPTRVWMVWIMFGGGVRALTSYFGSYKY